MITHLRIAQKNSCKHDPKVKAVRVNGQIKEVKQLLAWAIPFGNRNFFSLAES